MFDAVVVPRHPFAAPSKPEVKNTLWTVGEVLEERVTVAAERMVASLWEAVCLAKTKSAFEINNIKRGM